MPGDKSITHRSFLFSGLASGRSRIQTDLMGRDNLASLRIMRQLGVHVVGTFSEGLLPIAREEGFADIPAAKQTELVLTSDGLERLSAPSAELYCGNSGTTARLLCGILASCPFEAVLSGDESLSRRPFKRVREPLEMMGATFSGEQLPLRIRGGALGGIAYVSPRASAQVKSAILLAGLRANGEVTITEPKRSRDHTERMLSGMGCDVRSALLLDGTNQVSLGVQRLPLSPVDIEIPGDFSSAGFFLVAASLIPGSEIRIRNVGVNPTRIGLLHLLRRMGASIDLVDTRVVAGEDVADLIVKSAELTGIKISADEVVDAIDEIPILAVAGAFASGTTEISGAEELRVKESDRIAMMAKLLELSGVGIEERVDGFIIEGGLLPNSQAVLPRFSQVKATGDHRISMSCAVLELVLSGGFEILDPENIETSFPGFVSCFQMLTGQCVD